MPTVLRAGPYRLFFYAGDRTGPVHVQVERDAHRAKFWLTPVRLAENDGFSAKDALVVELVDGRTITVPLPWYPRLAYGTEPERADWRLIGAGEGIHWPDLDEDISVEHLLSGARSGESERSLRRWVESRR